MTKLRKEARDNNVYLHVVRNTLLARAVEGTEFECMKDSFKGPTLIGFSLDHPGELPVFSRILQRQMLTLK